MIYQAIKKIRFFNFLKKYINFYINIFGFTPDNDNSYKDIIHLFPSFSQCSQHFGMHFAVWVQTLPSTRPLSPQSWQLSIFLVFSVLWTAKNRRWLSPVNTVAKAWMQNFVPAKFKADVMLVAFEIINAVSKAL